MNIETQNIIVLENDEKNYKKSNELIRKSDSFSSKESHLEDIFHQNITNSNREKKSLKYDFSVSYLLKQLNLRPDDHTALSELTKGMSKPVEILDTDAKRLFQGSMFTFVYENFGALGSVVSVNINEEAAKFFYNLKKSKQQVIEYKTSLFEEKQIESIFSYTSLNKEISQTLNDINKQKARKFYEIVKSNEFKHQEIVSLVISVVKSSLGMEGKYKKPYDFYHKFLLPTVDTINEFTDLWINLKLRKQGKSYQYIDVKVVGGNLFRQFLQHGFTVDDEKLNQWFLTKHPKFLGLVLIYIKLLLKNNKIDSAKIKIQELMSLKKLSEQELKGYIDTEKEEPLDQILENDTNSNDKNHLFQGFKKTDTYRKYMDLGYPRNDHLLISKFEAHGEPFLKQALEYLAYHKKKKNILDDKDWLSGTLNRVTIIKGLETPLNKLNKNKKREDEIKIEEKKIENERKKKSKEKEKYRMIRVNYYLKKNVANIDEIKQEFESKSTNKIMLDPAKKKTGGKVDYETKSTQSLFRSHIYQTYLLDVKPTKEEQSEIDLMMSQEELF